MTNDNDTDISLERVSKESGYDLKIVEAKLLSEKAIELQLDEQQETAKETRKRNRMFFFAGLGGVLVYGAYALVVHALSDDPSRMAWAEEQLRLVFALCLGMFSGNATK